MNEPKAASNLKRTADAAKSAGVSKQSLQYYLMVGVVQPTQWTPSGQQLFDEQAIARIRLIKRLNESGYPLREIREIFLRRQQPTEVAEGRREVEHSKPRHQRTQNHPSQLPPPR